VFGVSMMIVPAGSVVLNSTIWRRKRCGRGGANGTGHIGGTRDCGDVTRGPIDQAASHDRHRLRREKRAADRRCLVNLFARGGLHVARVDRNAAGVAVNRRPIAINRHWSRRVVRGRIVLRRGAIGRAGQRQGDDREAKARPQRNPPARPPTSQIPAQCGRNIRREEGENPSSFTAFRPSNAASKAW
jgi:hypothetical protein